MSWNGIKKYTNNANIEAWCEEMGIKNYIINSKGEIDVDGDVSLANRNIKELPFKFGEVSGYFDMGNNKNLISLKNCPEYVRRSFGCDGCTSLNSLEGCPKKVMGKFFCGGCKRKFTQEEVQSLCKVKGSISN